MFTLIHSNPGTGFPHSLHYEKLSILSHKTVLAQRNGCTKEQAPMENIVMIIPESTLNKR